MNLCCKGIYLKNLLYILRERELRIYYGIIVIVY